MTVNALALTAVSNTAKDFRNALSPLIFGATTTRPTGARSGVRYGTPTTTVSLSGFNGTIKPHAGIMDVQTSATAGPYFYAVTANETFTVSAAHATLARVDIVTVRINDDVEDASGLESATVHYKAGTAAASPVAPSPDTTRELIIATIAVPASGGGNPVVSWVAPYAVSGGGIIPVRTDTERDALQTAYPGTTDAPLVIWNKASSAFYYNDGTGWTALRPTPTPRQNLVYNGTFRTNQRGYVSATDLALNAYGFDGWKATTANSKMTFTAGTQGQQVTIASGDSFGQVVERANVPAGSYTLSWSGTSTARLYNVGGSAPSYASSPVTVSIDGAANVLAEFGPGTLSNVKLEAGSDATPFVLEPLDMELLKCYRWYYKRSGTTSARISLMGSQTSTTTAQLVFQLPATMGGTPTVAISNLVWTDLVNFNAAISAITVDASSWVTSPRDSLFLSITYATNGAALRPGIISCSAGSAGYIAFEVAL